MNNALDILLVLLNIVLVIGIAWIVQSEDTMSIYDRIIIYGLLLGLFLTLGKVVVLLGGPQ